MLNMGCHAKTDVIPKFALSLTFVISLPHHDDVYVGLENIIGNNIGLRNSSRA